MYDGFSEHQVGRSGSPAPETGLRPGRLRSPSRHPLRPAGSFSSAQAGRQCYKFVHHGLGQPKAAMARLVLLDSAAAEVAFFLALSLVPLVAGITIALVSLFRVGLQPFWEGVADDVCGGVSSRRRGAAVGGLRCQQGVADGRLPARALELVSLHVVVPSRDRLDDIPAMSAHLRGPGDELPDRGCSRFGWWRWSRWLSFLLVAPSIQHGLLGLPALSDLSSSVFSILRGACSVPGILFVAIWLTYRVAAGTQVGSRVALVALLGLTGFRWQLRPDCARPPSRSGGAAGSPAHSAARAVPDLDLPHRLDPPARRTPADAARLGSRGQLA